MKVQGNSFPILAMILLAGAALSVLSCSFDKEYEITPDKLNMEVTLMEDGISVPLGSTDKISIGSLLNTLGGETGDLIKTGADGSLSITKDGSVSLNEQLSDLNLGDLATMDGFSVSESFTYKMKDLTADDFSIPAEQYGETVQVNNVGKINIETQPVAAELDGLGVQAGLDKYKDVITGNADLDLSAHMGAMEFSQTIIPRADLAAAAQYAVTEEVVIPQELVPDVVLVPSDIDVKVDEISLNDDVTALTNVKTNPNAKMVVTLKLKNCFLTGGTGVPDVNMDFSKIFKIKGGSTINLKDHVLTADKNWLATKTYDIEGLAVDSFGSKISLSEKISVSGTVEINNPVTTKTNYNAATNDIDFELSITFTDLTIVSADMAVKPIDFAVNDNVSLGNYDNIDLPDEVSDVKSVIFDETKPLKFKVHAANLNRLKQKSIPCKFTFTFPEGMEVVGAVNRKLELNGNLADGDLTGDIAIKSVTPTVQNGKLSLDGNVQVEATITAQDLVVASPDLPETPEDDVTFSVSLEGEPVVKDLVVVTKQLEMSLDMTGQVSFPADKMEGLGNLTIIPEGNPAIIISISVPQIGSGVVPGPGGIKIILPDIIVFDASGIDAALGFNESENSITIKDQFPAQITLPIKEFRVSPKEIEGKIQVVSNYSASGTILVPAGQFNQSELEEIFNSSFGLTIDSPEIKAASIKFTEKLSIDVNQTMHSVLLKKENIPSEIKSIDELLLEDVFLNLQVAFEGLPEIEGSAFNVDLTLTLPEFISPNVIPVKGQVTGGGFSISPVKIEKLHGVDFSAGKDIEGDIVIAGTIYTGSASIDVTTFKNDIKATINASFGNKDGKIAISKATGVFSYDISESVSVPIGDIPDNFKGDNVNLDLADPQITLAMKTNIGIPLVGDLQFVPYSGGSALTANSVTIKNVRLPYSADPAKEESKTIYICRSAVSAPAGAEVIEANLSKLLSQIPDSLVVNINAGIDSNAKTVLVPSASYTLDLQYGINVPLAFGEAFKFSTDAELSLEGASDIIALGDFGIKGKVLNDTPLNLNVELELLDEAGNVVPQTKTSQVRIAAAKSGDVEFYLSPADKTKAVKNARLVIGVTALPNVAIKESDCLQLTDLKAVAPDGITVKP